MTQHDVAMPSLSIDTLFLTIEYLPYRDALSCLFVCKDWYSLNSYEIYWKSVYHRFIVSNIVEKFSLMKKYGVTKYVHVENDGELMELLGSRQNMEKSRQVLRQLRGMKSNSGQKNYPLFVIDRTIMFSLLSAFESHIFQDKTVSRFSLKYKLNETCRFKYLMEKQTGSVLSIAFNSFFNNFDNFIELSNEIVMNYISVVMEVEYVSNVLKFRLNPDLEVIQSKIFRRMLQQDVDPKYWKTIMSLTLRKLPELVPQKELSKVLKAVFEASKHKAQLSWMSIIYFNFYYYYEKEIELIIELIKKNGIDPSEEIRISSATPSIDLLTEYYNCIQYLQLLRQFKDEETLSTIFFQCKYFSGLIERLCNYSNSYLNDFLDKLPVSLLLNINWNDWGGNCAEINILKILEYAKGKELLIPQERIEGYIHRQIYYCLDTCKIIQFLIDNYGMDIYYICKKVRYCFSNFIFYLQRNFNNIEFYEELFNRLFSDVPIDLGKLNESTYSILELILKNWKCPHEFVQFCKKRFVQEIFTVQTACKLFSSERFELYTSSLELKQAVYGAIVLDENEKLSDYVAQLLEEKPHLLDVTTAKFKDYAETDPKFAISLYLYCNQTAKQEK